MHFHHGPAHQRVRDILAAVGEDPADYDIDAIVADLDGEAVDLPTVVSKFWRRMLSKRRGHDTARARRVEPDP